MVIFCGELGRNSKYMAERYPQQKCDDLVNILGLGQRVFLLWLYSWGSKNVDTRWECKPDAARFEFSLGTVSYAMISLEFVEERGKQNNISIFFFYNSRMREETSPRGPFSTSFVLQGNLIISENVFKAAFPSSTLAATCESVRCGLF